MLQVKVDDKGSLPRCVKVEMQGVPMHGIVDSGADITIIGGRMFKKVATVAKLKISDFRQTARNYDQKPFKLHGRMDLDITFYGKVMRTPVYIKMDASDQLLLSEGVCQQLGIVTYYPEVQQWRKWQTRRHQHQE